MSAAGEPAPATPAAAIDLGTNTVLMLVAAPAGAPGGKPRVLRDEMRIVRLGEGVDATRRLAPAAVARSLGALAGYAEILRSLGVAKDRRAAVATSALRDVQDGQAFLAEAASLLGVPLEIISGDEEARLTWLAVARAFPDLVTGRLRAVIDVGGGSTEVVLGRGETILERRSIDVGSVRLTERLVHEDPQTGAVLRLREAVRAALAPCAGARPAELVGVAGTVTTLAAVRDGITPYHPDRVNGLLLSRQDVESLIGRLAGLPLAERARVPGLEPKRADVIVAGAAIILEAMDALGVRELRVCDHGVRWGLWHDRFGG